jgi:hypothetical protein
MLRELCRAPADGAADEDEDKELRVGRADVGGCGSKRRVHGNLPRAGNVGINADSQSTNLSALCSEPSAGKTAKQNDSLE